MALIFSAEAQEVKKDIPSLTRQSVKAVVSVVASNKVGKEMRQGSGFVSSTDGKVVTNYHVIADADTVVIKFSNGAFYFVDGVLAADRERDIVILKASGKEFQPLHLGDSDRLRVGEEVVAIGSPLTLEATVSNGIISGLREDSEGQLEFIQTTAPISSGSSGGPLLNVYGKVIGITTFQITRGQNLNFAIPVNFIKPLLTSNSVKPLSAIATRPLPRAPNAEASTNVSPPTTPVRVSAYTDCGSYLTKIPVYSSADSSTVVQTLPCGLKVVVLEWGQARAKIMGGAVVGYVTRWHIFVTPPK